MFTILSSSLEVCFILRNNLQNVLVHFERFPITDLPIGPETIAKSEENALNFIPFVTKKEVQKFASSINKVRSTCPQTIRG
jgi:hypothetical protein